MTYRLGTGIGSVFQFQRIQKEDPIISNKILYIFAIVAVVKIATLLLWI